MAYLVVFLDDYSRYVVHGQFYFERAGTTLKGLPQENYFEKRDSDYDFC